MSKTDNDPVRKIYKIAEILRNITDNDIKQLEEMYKGQQEYSHPLKMGTVREQHELGNHNEKMVNCIKELRYLVTKDL